jgi:hypothetical protein
MRQVLALIDGKPDPVGCALAGPPPVRVRIDRSVIAAHDVGRRDVPQPTPVTVVEPPLATAVRRSWAAQSATSAGDCWNTIFASFLVERDQTVIWEDAPTLVV